MDDVTLAYLANPLYYSAVNKNKPDGISAHEIEFYKKRLFMLNKQLLQGEEVDLEVKRAHDEFIKVAIEHFKMLDKRDIIQKEYEMMDTSGNDNPPSLDNKVLDNMIDDPNAPMLQREKKITLDSFVIHDKKKNPPIKIPTKKQINLKDDKLRNKGIKKYKHKTYEKGKMQS